MTSQPVPAPTRQAGPRLALCIVTIAVGAVLGIGGLVVGIVNVVHAIDGPKATTPADLHVHLSSGTWQIYVRDEVEGLGTLSPSQVTVSGPDGARIATRALPSDESESLSSGSTSYHARVRFTAPHDGDYTVEVNGPPGERILLSKSLGDVARGAAIWFAVMGVGILIGFAGSILLVVGIIRRRNARRGPVAAYAGGYGAYGVSAMPAAGVLPPPGWYPDPQQPGTMRWWDGMRWTDQTSSP
jgi:hypothetical protein